jgi:hypothetical protein
MKTPKTPKPKTTVKPRTALIEEPADLLVEVALAVADVALALELDPPVGVIYAAELDYQLKVHTLHMGRFSRGHSR